MCRTIYSAILEGHLTQGGFDGSIVKLGARLTDAMLELHRNVMNNFLPSAVKFHYQFNLRELSNITQVSPPNTLGMHVQMSPVRHTLTFGMAMTMPLIIYRRVCAA